MLGQEKWMAPPALLTLNPDQSNSYIQQTKAGMHGEVHVSTTAVNRLVVDIYLGSSFTIKRNG